MNISQKSFSLDVSQSSNLDYCFTKLNAWIYELLDKYYPDVNFSSVFNDILEFKVVYTDYSEVLDLELRKNTGIVDSYEEFEKKVNLM